MAQQQPESYHPVLPRLRDDANIGAFNKAGRWVTREAAELINLSDGLKVERAETQINSIPDMWARPLLFEMALLDPKHLLHERVRGEWRGLLAILALKEVMSINDFKVLRVQVSGATADDHGETRGGGRRGAGGRPAFLAALERLMPRRTIADDASWDDLCVFLFGKRAIGMTSPTTLVSTATDYLGRVNNIPWSDGRHLLDPAGTLGRRHRQSLANWLEALTQNLSGHQKLHDHKVEWERLLEALGAFIDDLGGAQPGAALPLGATLGLPNGLLQHLDKPIKGGGDGTSYVSLVPSRQGPARENVLVVDRAIADQWNMEPFEILVYGGVPLDRVPFSGLNGNRRELAGVTLTNAALWRPREFFTEKLFVVPFQDAFPGALKPRIGGAEVLRYKDEVVTPLLPVNEKLLDYLTPEDIYSRISFQQSIDGVIVRLRLPLSGPDAPEGPSKDFEVSREFRLASNEIVRVKDVPVLEIWPDFRVPGDTWKAYYTYYSLAGVAGFDTFYAKPYVHGEEAAPREFRNSRAELERCVTRMEHFPEAMICEASVANPDTNQMEVSSAGLLLVEPPPVLRPLTQTLKIGIDFGAANTNVYVKSGTSAPLPINFEDRLRRVTASGTKRDSMWFEFLPGSQQKTPFQSLFQDFQLKADAQELEPLLDGHIYFSYSYESFNAAASGMATDLKWSEKEVDRIRARAFLEQLCLQSAAEAVARQGRYVSWAYSFPTSFSGQLRNGFPETWEQIVKSCADLTGVSLPPGQAEPASETESVAAALYFLESLDAPLATGTVCIDIGGSTSDIAIWQKSLRWQTSLLFAGRDMFLNLIREKPSFLNNFGADTSALVELKAYQTAFYAKADALVWRDGQSWLERLPNYIAKPEVEGFIQLIALSVSGIFYYIGLMLRHLMEQKNYEKEVPSVFVGGNASRLLHWLAAGSYKSSSHINKILRGVLAAASGLDDKVGSFKVQLSPLPKAEAAYGLVCGTVLDAGVAEKGVLAGETFVEGDKAHGWDEMLSAERLRNGLKQPPSLDRIKDFLNTFNQLTASKEAGIAPVSYDDALMQEIRQGLANAFASYNKHADDTTVVVEPVFLLALKELLRRKTQTWAGSSS
ncbi:MAG: hypothetical protein ACJ754_21210 [Pyrinomonadaceae bacterium]